MAKVTYPSDGLWFVEPVIDPVALFAIEMDQKLAQRSSKGGWENLSLTELLKRLRAEVVELEEAIVNIQTTGTKHIREEAADVANFAMMIHDQIMNGRLEC